MDEEWIEGIAQRWAERVKQDRESGWGEQEVSLASYITDAIKEALRVYASADVLANVLPHDIKGNAD